MTVDLNFYFPVPSRHNDDREIQWRRTFIVPDGPRIALLPQTKVKAIRGYEPSWVCWRLTCPGFFSARL